MTDANGSPTGNDPGDDESESKETMCAQCGKDFKSVRGLRVHQTKMGHDGSFDPGRAGTEHLESLYGRYYKEVPILEPKQNCNARRIDRDGDTMTFEGYCQNRAGFKTDHPGEGRCKFHGGQNTGPKTDDGIRRTKKNAIKTGVSSDPFNYTDQLDEPEASFVDGVKRGIVKRLEENKGDIDIVDEVLAMNVAIMMHIAFRAADYTVDEGMIESIMTADGRLEVKNRHVETFRMYNKDLVRILKDIGATTDPADDEPDVVVWREFIG